MLTDLWYYCDNRLGVVACLLPESSRRLFLFDVLFPVCPVDRRQVVSAMTLQSWCRWFGQHVYLVRSVFNTCCVL
ncbi:hypothetical protein Bca4012_079679 [Brassica carinata]|uniref:Uncharacterized protein n=1 Tax=Brassica oleracea TaxID=3712 RepID=A0A3P6F905_BRAOL|nr:unnamed protein product [Brassica oleracea]